MTSHRRLKKKRRLNAGKFLLPTLHVQATEPRMADDSQPDKVWDEYDWERFLQQQDRKTEKYMELLEKYIDHPDRDQIIAREMGWTHLLNEDGERWAEEVEEMFEEEMAKTKRTMTKKRTAKSAEGENYEVHPLYQASFALTVWLDQLFDEREDLQNHPAAVKLSTQAGDLQRQARGGVE
jgi:phage pi2 protein 07